MQKRNIARTAAVLVMGAAVAAALIWTGARRPQQGLSYDELLAMAGSQTAASSSEQPAASSRPQPEVPASSETAAPPEDSSALDEENSASAPEQPASPAESEVEQPAQSEAEAASGEPAPEPPAQETPPASSKPAASEAPAASAKPTEAPAASREPTADELCDAKLADYIRQIEALQARSERDLYRIMLSAYDEYMNAPEEKRNLMLKISVVLSKTGDLTRAQNECDKEFNAIIAQMRQTLRENGRDETLADEAEKTYKKMKNDMIKELTDQAYSGGDGSGQSGKWLKEHASELND